MQENRRNFLKLGATSAAVGVLGQATAADAPQPQVGAIAPLAAQLGLRLATFSPSKDEKPRIGVVLDNGNLIDIGAEAQRARVKLMFDPTSMLSLIDSGDAGITQVHALAEKGALLRIARPHVNQVQLWSPIPRPRANIYAVGWNYLDHFEEGKAARADKVVSEYPANPVFFTKGVNTMNSPFGSIPFDAGNSTQVDWEAELAVVIGRAGRNISEDQALNHVFGYTVYNDTTARDIQQKRHGGQWFKGKSLDGYGPMGPWIVTPAGIHLDDCRIISRVNGVEKQNASYQQMYFKIPRVIAELSRGMTLEPGDIITTGTPSGVGFSRKPPEFMKPGDVMETEVTGIGILRNLIKAEG
ncbi:fumarylacetoacetate hydrolase family protein [Duganella callida]|uniref:Twin-arginine translocation signal domain-containing protein n=1 Tax=Duganella callida TaxID=2561932 RepID=A0A4Y9SR09_9BURK|nr:fumarylacetoacetate hydrolase family protein [Duganella callida]TFW27917.1 twin-arginine translocation signal domain-containing protein [Duganella callida]